MATKAKNHARERARAKPTNHFRHAARYEATDTRARAIHHQNHISKVPRSFAQKTGRVLGVRERLTRLYTPRGWANWTELRVQQTPTAHVYLESIMRKKSGMGICVCANSFRLLLR